MPSVATWWCGQSRERAYVLRNAKRLVIKRVFRQYQRDSYFGPNLSDSELEALAKKEINANPEQWCAQEIVSQRRPFSKRRDQPTPFSCPRVLIRTTATGQSCPVGSGVYPPNRTW